ncbi:preprotein translocase subunit SecG [Patescibacteria group bacterium]|nr:preprotein translocase subunit SecG [Patescibacteria group bacterium]
MQVLSTLLPYIQLVVAVLLVGAILLQQRGTGLGAVFGGESNIYRTQRGFEKILFTSTIIFAALFIILAILSLLAQ